MSSNPGGMDAVRRHLSRNDLLYFTDYTFPKFRESWHHSILSDALNRVAERKCLRLIIQAPPRHSKTEMVSRRFSAYCLGRFPDIPIIATSYSASLASRNNRDVQRIMETNAYRELFPGTVIPRKGGQKEGKKRTNEFFELVGTDGSYLSAGVDGGITGMGFVIGIIDDPHKNRKEAESLVMREAAWDWYTSTFLTRMDEENAAIVVIQTRWHEDDLSGRLLALAKSNPEADQWEVVNLPALWDKDSEPMRAEGDYRKEGEALWPIRYPEKYLHAMKASQGSYDWESLYQQRPFPPGGRKIKTEKFVYVNRDQVPASVRWCFFGDLAVSSKTTADFTVMGYVGYDSNGDVYLRDVIRHQKEWPDTKKIMLDTICRAHEPFPVTQMAGIEKAGQQEGFIDDLNREPKLVALPLTIQHLPVDKDKLTRALPWIAKVDEEKFHLVNGAWIDDFITECSKFTGAGDLYDDQIDMVSGGYELVVSTYSNLTEMMVQHKDALMKMMR